MYTDNYDLELDEIAKQTRMTKRTVRRLLVSGMRKLRDGRSEHLKSLAECLDEFKQLRQPIETIGED